MSSKVDNSINEGVEEMSAETMEEIREKQSLIWKNIVNMKIKGLEVLKQV